jgi:hypothetical protein
VTNGKDNTGLCGICQQPLPTSELVGHIAVHHPDQYEPFETWPDGAVVVLHDSISPQDITPGEDTHG